MTGFIIEILGEEISICAKDGAEANTSEYFSDLLDCAAPGDVEEPCRYLLRHVGVEFRTVRRNAAGEYENVLADDTTKQRACEAIYFESEADFSDSDTAELYLVWSAASYERESH